MGYLNFSNPIWVGYFPLEVGGPKGFPSYSALPFAYVGLKTLCFS